MSEPTFEQELMALLKKHNKAITCKVMPIIVDVRTEESKEKLTTEKAVSG